MALDFTNTTIRIASVHQIGNKSRGEEIVFSKAPLNIEGDHIHALLMMYFLSPFRGEDLYNFSREDGGNAIFAHSESIFRDVEQQNFHSVSISIANLLYEAAANKPKSKSGELYVVYFEGVILDDEEVSAVGIFKSDAWDTYLKVEVDGQINQANFHINHDKGLNINNLDRGCLVLNTERDNGFVVACFDNSSSTLWKEDFLQLKERADSYSFTKNYLELSSGFMVAEDPIEQINNTQRLIDYFKSNKNFDAQVFGEEVIIDDDKMKFLDGKKQLVEEEKGIQIPPSFEINPKAVKKFKLQPQKTIQLDNKVTITVTNPNVIIKRGFDEVAGQKFYQIYYDNEK